MSGERLHPFAALFTNGDPPISIRLHSYDADPDDTLCFDQRMNPHPVVLCNGKLATDEIARWDDGEVEELAYDNFIFPVADSFTDFVDMLRAEP